MVNPSIVASHALGHREGETGFLVDSIDQAAEAVGKLGAILPRACRQNVEQRVEVPEPRKSTGKFLIANSNLALAA